MSNVPRMPKTSRWPPGVGKDAALRAIPPGAKSSPDQYGSFQASLLYCPTCRQATPTRERLLLVLPTGNLYEYRCAQCGTSTGSKTEKQQGDGQLFKP
jgi:hypothetical protein